MFLEEDFHCVKFLRYSFDIIESVNSDDDFDTFETTTESGNSLNDGILSERLRRMKRRVSLRELGPRRGTKAHFEERVWFDTNRESTDISVTPSEVYTYKRQTKSVTNSNEKERTLRKAYD